MPIDSAQSQSEMWKTQPPAFGPNIDAALTHRAARVSRGKTSEYVWMATVTTACMLVFDVAYKTEVCKR
jgi:hypothetical protein